MNRQLRPLVLALALAAPAAAQTPLLTTPADSPGPAHVGADQNGDGWPELWVGDPGPVFGTTAPGRVRIASGADGAPLAILQGEFAEDRFGSALAAVADLNGDGVDEVAVGAPGVTADPNRRPYVQVRSGADGALLARLAGAKVDCAFGSALVEIGDVDGDGWPELAIAARGANSGVYGHVEVRSVRSGALLWRTGSTGGEYGGQAIALARAGDLDGDGASELLVGSESDDRVELRSGADGRVLRTLLPPPSDIIPFGKHGFGAALAVGPDSDGNGLPDLLVGAPKGFVGVPTGGGLGYEGGPPQNGAVYLYPDLGLVGVPALRVVAAPLEGGFGSSVAALDDFDGDGVWDFVTGCDFYRTGCCHFHPGYSRVASSQDGRTLQVGGYASGGEYRSAGDWNGDGRTDFLVGGAKPASGATVCETRVIGGEYAPPLAVPGCTSTSGACPSYYSGTFATGDPSATSTDDYALHAYGMQSGSAAFLLLGTSAANSPFGTGTLCLAPPIARRVADVRQVGPSPACPVTLSYEFGPNELGQGLLSVGSEVFAQFVSIDPGGGHDLSVAVSFRVYP